jgi:hypothetical protein
MKEVIPFLEGAVYDQRCPSLGHTAMSSFSTHKFPDEFHLLRARASHFDEALEPDRAGPQ